jgi:hypothetical protein
LIKLAAPFQHAQLAKAIRIHVSEKSRQRVPFPRVDTFNMVNRVTTLSLKFGHALAARE